MVDEDGCPIADVVLLGVNFETDSATLTAQSKPVLDEVAKGLKDHHRLKVELPATPTAPALRLTTKSSAQRRADSVRDYLVSQGVPESQLTTKGYGQTQPVASNATREGRLQNRRVQHARTGESGRHPGEGSPARRRKDSKGARQPTGRQSSQRAATSRRVAPLCPLFQLTASA